MLPRWHVVLGAIFSFLFWIVFPKTSLIYLVLIFLSSFLIDFDHYVNAVMRNKSLSLPRALDYYAKISKQIEAEHERGIRRKEYDFQFFHTIEFHIVVALLGFGWPGFWYILIGMVFHSLLDVIYLLYKDYFYMREYFFFSWLVKNI